MRDLRIDLIIISFIIFPGKSAFNKVEILFHCIRMGDDLLFPKLPGDDAGHYIFFILLDAEWDEFIEKVKEILGCHKQSILVVS